MTQRGHIVVAGINGPELPAPALPYIVDSSCPVVCSKAYFSTITDRFPELDTDRWIPVTPLQDCFDRVSAALRDGPVLFLVSGDPLFYGIGRRLSSRFSDMKIRYFPALSFMQSCFSHVGLSWDDADFLSLHGREISSLEAKLNSNKLFIFTDSVNSPDVIAAYLKNIFDYNYGLYTVHVAEHIGSDRQRLISGGLDDIAAMDFTQPNSMIVVRSAEDLPHPCPRFGLTEKEIAHSRGLITKSEVRAAVLHRLQLPDNGVLWDIGAGSGSVSIEAARLFQSLSVWAIEKNDEQLENIRTNRVRYGCANLHVVEGSAPDALEGLKRPDRVFIGGSGGKLEEIIEHLACTISGPLRIVATAVLEKTERIAPEKLHAHGFDVEISRIETKRYRYPHGDTTTFNPISLICGTRS